MTSRTRT